MGPRFAVLALEFDAVARRLLAEGESVENICHAIFLIWLYTMQLRYSDVAIAEALRKSVEVLIRGISH